MPVRNLIVIVLASLLSLVCYAKTPRNRFASLYAEAVDHVSAHYIEEVAPRTLFEGAMNGMLSNLDPYSQYIGPAAYQEFQENLEQEFGGIGVMVELNPETDRLTVLSPIVGTPAYEAGMMAGDIILEVDGESTEGFGLPDAVELLRGPAGTTVKIQVQHKGDPEPVEMDIVRAKIEVPSVLGDIRLPDGNWSFLLEDNPRIGYIRVITFGDHTVSQLRDALRSIEAAGAEGLILDLRYNAGGLLTAAIETCDMFIDEGMIVSTRGRNATIQKQFEASSPMVIEAKMPIAVLVNKYSASASEIVAACLQDHGRAVVGGRRTWGKGTVQNVITLEMGKSLLKLTTATYWRPSGQNIHRGRNTEEDALWGVMPDDGFDVELTREQEEQIARQRRQRDYIDDGDSTEADDPETGESDNDNGDAEDDVADDVADDVEDDVEDEIEGNVEEGSVEDNSDNDGDDAGPIDDPQMRRMIEYIERMIDQQKELAA
jgi:carboxyl-terminal processing protease